MKRHWLFTWRGITRSVGVRFVAVVLLLQILVAVGTGVYAEREMWKRFERHEIVPVKRFRDSVLAQYKLAGIEGLRAYVKERVSTNYSDDVAIILAAPDGRILAGNMPHWPSHLIGDADWSTGTLRVKGSEVDQHMGLLITQLDGGYRLLTGKAVISEDRLIAAYARMIMLSVIIAIITSVLIAAIASWMIGRQLSGIVNLASRVADGDFSARLQPNGSGDRFDDLMRWINRTMDRLDTTVGELRLVGGGLAHDLRSPITRLRVTLERALSEVEEPKAIEAMNKMMVETDALLAMLAMALQISNAEAGANRDRFKPTDVASLLNDLAEIYGPLAEERGFTISVDAPADMEKLLHRELLGQALSNLIENALNYAYGGTRIMLVAMRQRNDVVISVSDNGTGIPEHRRDDARRRYGRLDTARQLPGAGLGLSLVEAVARLHGGEMALSDNAPGLIVSLTFPARR
jgi:signal transduction histidine kinase